MASKPTVQSILDYYSNLLIIQYNNQPKAVAEIQSLVKAIIANNISFDIRDGFNLDINQGAIAIGAQLDLLDLYVGAGRFYNGVALSDADYLQLILLKIIQNNSNHSHKSIDASLYYFFGANIIAYSNGHMLITYFIYLSSTVLQAAIAKGILPRPMGVGVNIINYVPITKRAFWFAKADGTYALPNVQGGFAEAYFPVITTI
jgi:Protein of unknown function (DUF2612)